LLRTFFSQKSLAVRNAETFEEIFKKKFEKRDINDILGPFILGK